MYVLSREFAFDGDTLARAIKATFKRRKTVIPIKPPQALTDEFGRDEMKSIQWNAFIRKSGLEECIPELLELLSHLRDFLLPPMKAAAGDGSFQLSWARGGLWS